MPAVQETIDQVKAIDVDQYKYGFVTDIESEKGAKGLSEETIRFLSAKKNEPEWMTEWRLDALRRFQQMDEPRTDRNRFHLDISVPHDVAERRVAAAIAAGGTLVSDRRAKAFWVLADADGNEACICTWQDRT